jgi:hypothetical protein
MKTYKKVHSNLAAAESHAKKIRKRGGVAKLIHLVSIGKTEVVYYFPK